MRHVLFVCTHNAGRSQMAQAFFEAMAPEDVRAQSAGTDPRREVWPVVVRTMREVGIDIADRRPKKLDLDMQLHTDWAVTMGCGDACPYVPARVEAWDVADPAGLAIEEVRAIRDEIERLVGRLIHERLDAIRADRSAHELRLARLLPALVDEFELLRTPQEIRSCLDRVLQHYDEAPVRSFVFPPADRRARECLARPTCNPDLVL